MEHDIERLGTYVKARREELGLTQKDLARHGGPSDTTVSKIEMGKTDRIQPKTARELDEALRWRSGSSESIMAGGKPVELEFADAIDEMARSAQEIELRSTSVGKDADGNMEFEIEGRSEESRLTITYGTGSRLRTILTSDLVDAFEEVYRRLLGATREVATTVDAWKVGPPPAPATQYTTGTTAHTSVLAVDATPLGEALPPPRQEPGQPAGEPGHGKRGGRSAGGRTA